MNVSLGGDDVEGFDTELERRFLSVKATSNENILERMYELRLRYSE